MVADTVRWEELLPREFLTRQQQLPLVYMPLGLCEPHGHAAAFGLDTLKAVWLCEQAARRFGGIVAPTQGYQIHETGYHKPWLHEVMDEGVNPHLGSIPPDVLLRMVLFQIRAFVNAGFRGIVLMSGHHGNAPDLRIVAKEVMRDRPVRIITLSDPELVTGIHQADHAGVYELSQLLYIRPDLVDQSRLSDSASSVLGRFAQGEGAAATAALGEAIMQDSLTELGRLIDAAQPYEDAVAALSFDDTEAVWARVEARRSDWCTLKESDPLLTVET